MHVHVHVCVHIHTHDLVENWYNTLSHAQTSGLYKYDCLYALQMYQYITGNV